jgi:hypothetical protein
MAKINQKYGWPSKESFTMSPNPNCGKMENITSIGLGKI